MIAVRITWLQVINQALKDARLPKGNVHRGPALYWLTHDSADLEEVCSNAGLTVRDVRKARRSGKTL